jgi:hypothetical protein
MSTEPVSRWWYGIATTIFLLLAVYVSTFIFALTGISEPAGSDAELVIKVLSLAATAIVAGVYYAMTPVYAICFVLDWRDASNSDRTAWSPTGWYLLVPIGALSNLIVPEFGTTIIVAGGGYYILQRSRNLGRPDLSRLRARWGVW